MSFRLRHLAFFAFIVLVVAVLVYPKPRERALWEKRGGDLGRIIERYRLSVRDRPEDIQLTREFASYLIEATSFDEAVVILEGQISRGQEPAMAARVLGHMHENLADPRAAARFRREVLRSDFTNQVLLLHAVRQLLWLEDHAGVIELMQEAVSAGAQPDAELTDLVARAYETEGRLKDALVWRQRLTTLKPRSLRAWLDVADLHQLLGHEEAELAVRRSIWEKTGNIDHGLFYARRLDEWGRVKALQEFLAELVKVRPDDPAIGRFAAAAVIQARDLGSRSMVETYITRWGQKDGELRFEYGQWLHDEKDPDAPKVLEALLADVPELPAEKRALALGYLGRLQEAADLWEALLETHPVEARVELSDLYVRLGKPELATGHARALWNLAPTLDRGLNLADLLMATGKPGEALDILLETERRHGFNQAITAKAAILALEAARPEDARASALALESRGLLPSTVLYVRARLLHDEARHPDAEALLSRGEREGVSSDAAVTAGQLALLRCLNALNWPEAPRSLVDRLVAAQVQEDPADTLVPFLHVQWLQTAGHRAEADAAAAMLLSRLVNPTLADERVRRAMLLSMTGRRSESIALWEGLRAEKPVESLTALTELQEAEGNIPAALEASTALVELRPDRPNLRRHALLLARAGRPEEASALMGDLVRKSPGDRELILDALWVHLEAGLYTEADPFLKALSEVDRGPAPALFSAVFALRQKQPAVAIEQLKTLGLDVLESGCTGFGGARDVSYTACTALLEAGDGTTALFGMTARELVMRHLGLHPGDATLALDVAAVEQKAGRPEAALDCLESALALLKGTTSDAVRADRARILTGLKRPEAVAAWEELITALPDEALPALVGIHREAGNWDEAVRRQQELVALHPHEREPRMALAFLLDEAKRPDEALGVWEALLDENRGDGEAARVLTYALLDSGRSAKALEVLGSYLAVATHDEPMRLIEAQVLFDAARAPEALASLGALPSLTLDAAAWSPAVRDPATLRLMVAVFLAQEDTAFELTAKAALEMLPPEEAAWRYQWALWVGARGRTAESEALLAVILDGPAVSSDSADDAMIRGTILVQLRRFDEALALADTLRETRPIPSLEIRVAALRELEDPHGALEALEELIALEPSRARSLERIGLLTECSKRLEALEACETFIAEQGPDKEAYAAWVFILVDINNYEAAHRVQREMRLHFPDDPLTRQLRASLLYEGGSVAAALERLESLRGEGKLAKNETLYSDVLLDTTGRWPEGLSLYVSHDTTPLDRESDRVWWRRRQLEELYRTRLDAEVYGIFGEGSERVYRAQVAASMYLHERLRGELGVGTTRFSKDEDLPYRKVSETVNDAWLLGEFQVTGRRFVQLKGALDSAEGGRGFSWKATAWGRERRWDWRVWHDHDAVAKRLTNLVGVGGREQRTEGELAVPDPWNPFIYSGGYGVYADTVEKKLNHATGTEDAGDGRLWWLSARWEIQGLVPHRQVQWGLQYRFLNETYDPELPGIMDLAPFAEERRTHGLTLDGHGQWDRTWEWLGYVSLGRDTAVDENSWGTGHRLIWRSDEDWRVGAGFDFGSAQGDGDTGKFVLGRIDAQVKF